MGFIFSDVSPLRFIANHSGILELESNVGKQEFFMAKLLTFVFGCYQVRLVHVRADQTGTVSHLCYTSPNCNGTKIILCP